LELKGDAEETPASYMMEPGPETLFAKLTARILQEEAVLIRGHLQEMGIDTEPLEMEKKESVAPLPAEVSESSAGGCSGCAGGCPE